MIQKEVKRIQGWQVTTNSVIEYLQECYNVESHPVMNESLRPNRELKTIIVDEETGESKEEFTGVHMVNRIVAPIAKDIVDKAVAFACGNPLDVSYEGGTDEQLATIQRVMNRNKEMSLNRKFCRALFGFRESAEIWYFDDESKIRCYIVSPMYGHTLYPEIDRFGKMQSFAYQVGYKNEDGEDVQEITHYTRNEIIVYRQSTSGWEEVEKKKNLLKKIPVAYINQGRADYEDVVRAMNRYELSSSNLSDSVDDNAYPERIYSGVFKGQVETPGQGGKYTTEGEGDIKVVEASQGTGLIDADLKNVKEIIAKYSQTPDLSFENLKGLGGVSGQTLKRLLTDAYLKVQSKREYLDIHYTRRYNIVKAMVDFVNKTTSHDLIINVEVVPYIPQDVDADVDRLNKISLFMPKRYVIAEYKKLVDPSIDVDQVMKWVEEESQFEFGGSLMVESEEV